MGRVIGVLEKLVPEIADIKTRLAAAESKLSLLDEATNPISDELYGDVKDMSGKIDTLTSELEGLKEEFALSGIPSGSIFER